MSRSASCTARTVSRLCRSRRSQSRYCGLASTFKASSAFDMDIELLPEGAEIIVELRGIARRHGGEPAAILSGKPDRMLRLHLARPPRQHDHALGHADCFADIVGDEDHGLGLAAQNVGDLIGEREPGL